MLMRGNFNGYKKDLKVENFTRSDRVLIDTNILLLIKNPYRAKTDSDKVEHYDSYWNELINSGADLFITTEVVGEYLNRILRNSFTAWKKDIGDDDADYKHGFRRPDNKQYINAFEYAKNVLKDEIFDLPNIKIIDTLGERTKKIINQSDPTSLDFTDELLISTAKANNLSIFTDDKDYLKKDIKLTVYTA